MFKVLIPAAASIALVAFAARTQPVETTAPDAPAMAWHVSHEGEMAKLAYGAANSDQLALMITCAPGEATAVVYGDVQPDTPRLVQTSLGPAPLDPLSGGEAQETRVALSDPSLRGLARRGAMSVVGDAGRFTLTASPGERQAIAGFLSYCGSARA